jgi:hypothetical protein
MERALAEVETALAQQSKYDRPKPSTRTPDGRQLLLPEHPFVRQYEPARIVDVDHTPSAMDRLAEIEKACTRYFTGEQQYRLRLACGHAEMLRVRRNAAAHDAAETFALDEADQLLVLAVSALESFFSIIIEATPTP